MILHVLILGLFVYTGEGLFGFGFAQSVAIKGRLMCNGKPAADVLIKMYDKDLIWDSKMGETRTDSDGYFSMIGHGREISEIDAKVNFYHDCENSILRCKRKFSIFIPSRYIQSGDVPSITYDFHQMELAGEYPSESHDCIHRRR